MIALIDDAHVVRRIVKHLAILCRGLDPTVPALVLVCWL